MPYTTFCVELGFSAVGAIGHRKLADGICGALIVQCDEHSKEKVGMVEAVVEYFRNYLDSGIYMTLALEMLIIDDWEPM